jgi:chorismate mutase
VVRAVRGAIQVDADTVDAIWDGASRLVTGLLSANAIREKDIVSLVFSVTSDLRSGNPATGVRRTGFDGTPLFCVQEAGIEGAMPRVIRALLTWNARGRTPAVPVYLGGAEALRPDLSPARR